MARSWTGTCILALAAAAAWGQAGTWEGTLTLDGSTLAVAVRLEESPEGWSGTFDVPPQAIQGLALAEVAVEGGRVVFAVPGLPGAPRFDGHLDGERLDGRVEAEETAPPSTDIHLLRLEPGEDGPAGAVPIARVTDREGYDNQPAFEPDGTALLYTSQRGDQTDIYRYDLATGATTQLTATPESEYSPTPMPDGERFSAVRVEADGTQRLWAFPLPGGEPQLLLPGVAPVGYHAWLDADTVALFVLGEPVTLRIASLAAGTAEQVAEDIGRCLQASPFRLGVSYVDKSQAEAWTLRTANLEPSGSLSGHSFLGSVLPEREDFVWASPRDLLMGSGSTLYRGDIGHGSIVWHPIADLGETGIDGITRLAVSPDGTTLALVAERPSAGEPETVTGAFELRLVERP